MRQCLFIAAIAFACCRIVPVRVRVRFAREAPARVARAHARITNFALSVQHCRIVSVTRTEAT